jgi:hypothetical protein
VKARFLIVALALLAGGCEDLRQFADRWSGKISRDPQLQHGFPAESVLGARIAAVTRETIDMTITLPGQTTSLRFDPIRRASGDVLADVQFAGEPLRTFFGFVSPPSEPPYLTVVSLFAEDRVEVRLIRGPDEAYAVFALGRVLMAK